MLSLALLSLALPGEGDLPPLPNTPEIPVTDTFHGVTVTENYRWLENPADPNVKAWADAQNKRTRTYFESIPARKDLLKAFKKIYGSRKTSYGGLRKAGSLFFALKYQPPKNQPILVTLPAPDNLAGEKILLDLNKLNAKGTTAMDFYVPSLDGRYVAVCLSENGSEDGSLYVYETATGKRLKEFVPRVNYPTAGGSAAWNADGSGFYYTRYPQGDERAKDDVNFYQQVWFHKMGTPASADTYIIGKEFPRIAEIVLETTPDGSYLLAAVANGDGGEYAHYLRGPAGEWKQVTRFADSVRNVFFGKDGFLYLISRKDAPRGKALKVPLSSPDLAAAKTIVPETEAVLEDLVPTATKLYAEYLTGGPSQIRIFDLAGKPQGELPTPPISSNRLGTRLDGDAILYSTRSYNESAAVFQYDAASGKSLSLPLVQKSDVDFSDVEVTREFAVSKDGTKVPLNIIHRKGVKRDGTNPTILYAYGGYGINETPGFDPGRRVWLDNGGVFVTANIRGGGEFGEAWHLGGNLTKKQNVFDDFLACAEHLLKAGYTSSAKLAIMGGSNGGLLMGAALTQRPDLFRAVLSYVGIYDMLRVELSPNGAFNVTEFGTVQDPAQFKALLAYSPYHNVKDGTAYPAVLFVAGDNDGRVEPFQSRKMTARLQAANPNGKPIFLRTSAESGHGIGTGLSERIIEAADVHAFLFDQLGIGAKTGK